MLSQSKKRSKKQQPQRSGSSAAEMVLKQQARIDGHQPATAIAESDATNASAVVNSTTTNGIPNNDSKVVSHSFIGTGCLICGKDEDDEKILLCEKCDGEYHIYCLQPPLKDVPKHDWFCDNCGMNVDDGLEQLVAALPPAIRARYGEICWAQGGTGYGWWPCIIYDPTLTAEPARSQARRYLGTRHLVYFFQCSESPFSILPDKQIKDWFSGLAEDCHLGKAAKNQGKSRTKNFREALQLAVMEMDKPVHERLDWEQNASSPNASPLKSPSPNKRPMVEPASRKRKAASSPTLSIGGRPGSAFQKVLNNAFTAASESNKKARGPSDTGTANKPASRPRRRRPSSGDLELNRYASADVAVPIPDLPTERSRPSEPDLVCQIVMKVDGSDDQQQIGFIVLPAKSKASFVLARKIITEDHGSDLVEDWKFDIAKLGKVSRRQESKLGAMFPFWKLAGGAGEGTYLDPLVVTITKA